MFVKAKDLQPGDKVKDADGNTLTVKSLSPGLARALIMINWRGNTKPDWSSVPPNAEIETVQ